jgi:hypothetical protein
MLTKKQLQKLCSKAADVIERDGLMKEFYGTKSGPKCALGALRVAHSGDPYVPLKVGADDVADLMREARPRSRRETIVDFNDAPRTRKRDVVELLRDMAAVR